MDDQTKLVFRPEGDQALHGLLSDPVIQAVMVADGVSTCELTALLHSVAKARRSLDGGLDG